MRSRAAPDLARTLGTHLDAIETGFSVFRARSSKVAGTINVAGPAEWLTERAAPALAALVDHDIRVRIHLGGRKRIHALLAEGTIDLAFLASTPDSRAVDFREIGRETLMLVASPAIARTLRATGTGKELLAAQPMIAYDEDLPLTREYFQEVFAIRLESAPVVTVPDLRAVRALVIASRGIAVLPDYLCTAALAAGHLELLHSPDVPPVKIFHLAWGRANLRHPRVAFARDRLLAELAAR